MRARLAARGVTARLGPLRWPGRDKASWIDRKKGAAYQPPVMEILVHDVRTAGPVPEVAPAGLSQVARARRVLARRLADELVNPPVPHTPGHDLVSAHAISLPVKRLASVDQAMRDAIQVPLTQPKQVWMIEGDGGSVTLLHGEGFSLVYRYYPVQVPMLVLVDELPGYAVRVDEDTSEYAGRLRPLMIFGIMRNFETAIQRARERLGSPEG